MSNVIKSFNLKDFTNQIYITLNLDNFPGYSYIMNRSKEDRIYWVCRNRRKKCKGTDTKEVTIFPTHPSKNSYEILLNRPQLAKFL